LLKGRSKNKELNYNQRIKKKIEVKTGSIAQNVVFKKEKAMFFCN